MSEKQKDVEQEATVTREDVENKVKSEFLSKFKTDDGQYDFEGMAKAYFLKDEKLHYANKEAKDRRLALQEKEDAILERERKIKQSEEDKLKEQEKFKELFEKKELEYSELESQLGEFKKKTEDLNNFRATILEKQKESIEKKKASLGGQEREIFETAALGFPDDYTRQEELLTKLSGKHSASIEEPPIKREGESIDSNDALMELKKRNPDAYMAKLRESIKKEKK